MEERQVDVNVLDRNGRSCLEIACEWNYDSVAEMIVSLENAKERVQIGDDVIFWSVSWDMLPVVRVLIEQFDVSPNFHCKWGSLLHVSVYRNSALVFDYLLELMKQRRDFVMTKNKVFHLVFAFCFFMCSLCKSMDITQFPSRSAMTI